MPQPSMQRPVATASNTHPKPPNVDTTARRVLLVGPSLEQKGGMASVQKLIFDHAPPGISIRHISTHDEGSMLHRLRVFAIALTTFLSLLLQNKVDLVHLHVSEKGSVLRKILLLLMAKAFRKPTLMHTHGCEFHTFHDGLPRWLQSWVNAALQQADRFIVLSESWRTYYLSHCGLDPARVIVLPNPVKIPAQVPDRTGSKTVHFVFLGRVGQRKGSFDLIEAFARLPVDCRNKAQITLAGDGELKKAQTLIEKLNLTAAVKLSGWIDARQRNHLLQSASIFILPSYNEGLPMAILEAMAWGLPVISTPVGGIPEIVDSGETGYLVNPGDLRGLAAAMQSLIEDDALRQIMGCSARERVKPMDLKAYYSRLMSIYSAASE